MSSRSIALFSVLGMLACGDNQRGAALDAPAGDGTVVADAPADASPVCAEYPIRLQPIADAQAMAQAELATVSPAATLTWSDNRGTLASIIHLDRPLPGCVAGVDVHPQVAQILGAHAATFQLDLGEWSTPEFFDCQFADGALVNIGRRTFAGRPIARDVFAYALANVGGVMTLTNVFGTYVPTAPPGVADAMASCNTLTEPAAIAIARQTPLQANTFEQCNPTGTVSYTPNANDTFTFAPDETWTWDDDSTSVLLLGQRTVRVTLDPSNYTPALLASAARCPVGDGDDFTVGFDIVFDVHTGLVLQVTPGLDCIVC